MSAEPSIWSFVVSFSRHLVMLGELGILAAILIFGAGSGIGLPLLFWHEKRYKQFFNGVFVALFAAETLFVGFLLDSRTSSVALSAYFAAGASAMVLVVAALAAVALVIDAFTSPRKGAPLALQEERGSAVAIAPAMRVKPGQPMRSARAPKLPLLLGVSVGSGLVAINVQLFSAVESWLTRLSGSTVAVFLTLSSDDAREPRNILAGLFFSAFFGFYLAGAVSPRLRRVAATPAIAFCALLAVIAGAIGFWTFHDYNPLVILVVVLALMWLGGASRYKIRLPALAKRYAPTELVRTYPSPAYSDDASTLLATESIGRWRGNDHRPRPLAVVCASGGGIRAAVWTSAILAQLEQELEDFPYQTRLIAGASGGMVGAAAWVTSLTSPLASEPARQGPRTREELEKLARHVARDALSNTLKHLVFCDLPLAFWPRNQHDRGRTLESTWQENVGPAFGSTFADLLGGEREGWRPSLVFSPMLIEDGRRLLISNLDLEFLTMNVSGRDNTRAFSRSAYQFGRLFPADWPRFPVTTAARMSASFPYISPAAVLPTEPRRRVVDAGYYDNYGVDVATGWLQECYHDPEKRAWLRKMASGVAIIQIRDGVSALARVDRPLGDDRPPIALARGFEGVSGPPSGVLAARESVALFRNDEQLESLCDLFNKDHDFGPGFLTTSLFEFDGKASLSWYLAHEETDALLDHAHCGPEFAKLHATMTELQTWWRGRQ